VLIFSKTFSESVISHYILIITYYVYVHLRLQFSSNNNEKQDFHFKSKDIVVSFVMYSYWKALAAQSSSGEYLNNPEVAWVEVECSVDLVAHT